MGTWWARGPGKGPPEVARRRRLSKGRRTVGGGHGVEAQRQGDPGKGCPWKKEDQGRGCPGEEMVRGAGSGARGGGGPAEVVQRRRWPREGGLGKQGQERWPRGRNSPGMVAQRRKRSRVGVAQGGRRAGGGGEMAQQRLCRGGGPGWEGRERSPRGWLPGRRPSRGGGGPGAGAGRGKPRAGRDLAGPPRCCQVTDNSAQPCRCRAMPGGAPCPLWVQAAGRGASRAQTPRWPGPQLRQVGEPGCLVLGTFTLKPNEHAEPSRAEAAQRGAEVWGAGGGDEAPTPGCSGPHPPAAPGHWGTRQSLRHLSRCL